MNAKTIVLIVILIILAVAGGYYLRGKYTLTPVAPTPTEALATPTPTDESIVKTTPATTTASAVKATPTLDETEALKTEMKDQISAEHKSDPSTFTITVSTVSGNFAKGMANASGGGGIWFAAKVNGAWKLVFDGNGIVQCAQLTAYPDFPNTLIPDCWDDAAQKMMTR